MYKLIKVLILLICASNLSAQIKSNYGIPTDTGDVEMYLPTIEDWNKLINRIDDIEKQLKSAKENDQFAEIRNLTAKQIASDYTVKENKVWAKLLGLKNYSRLTEPILSQLIFEELNK